MKYIFKIQYGSGNLSNTNTFKITENTLIEVLDKNITKVIIPNNVIEIGSAAFENTSLTEVDIPDSVITIGLGAFQDCKNLTSVKIGNNVEIIGGKAFENTSITEVDIPDSVKTINYNAFSECSSLTKVTIGESVTTIGWRAFFDCENLTSVKIGNNVIEIGNGAFEDTSLTEVDIPNSVKTIGWGAFQDCENLTSVKIGNNVIEIGNRAFDDTSLTEVVIPDSVKTIGYGAFFDCENLTSVKIGNKVENIGIEAFKNTSLTQVDIPNSVITIGNRAFQNCKNLTSVKIGNKVEIIGGAAFENTSLTQVDIPNSVIAIGNRAFQDCKNLTSVKIGNKVEIIGSAAFENTSLTEVDIPDSVITIDNDAFDINVVFKFSPIKKLLEELGKYKDKVTFYIDRNYVYDSIYYKDNKYKIFDNGIFVKFLNEVGIDRGGLKNDFFNLLSKDIFDNFMKEDDNYCIIKNDNNYDKDNYFFIGKLFAYAIKVRANIEIRLHPLLLHMLINFTGTKNFNRTSLFKLINIGVSFDDINSNEKNEKMNYELDYQYHWNNLNYDINKIRTILEDYDPQLLEEGIISSSLKLIETPKKDWTNYVNTLCLDELDYMCENNSKNEIEIPYENKELLVELKIKSYLYNKKSEETEAFIRGFHSIIDPSLLKDISMKDLNLLIAGNNNIDVNLFLDNLEFVNDNNEQLKDEQLELIKNIIIEYANEDNTYLNEFLFWIANKKTLSHNGYKDFGKKLQVRFVPEDQIKKRFTFTNKQGKTVESEEIEIGSHTCTNFVYTEVPNTWLINDDDGTAESKLRTGFSKVMIISYSEGKFTSAGGACSI